MKILAICGADYKNKLYTDKQSGNKKPQNSINKFELSDLAYEISVELLSQGNLSSKLDSRIKKNKNTRWSYFYRYERF